MTRLARHCATFRPCRSSISLPRHVRDRVYFKGGPLDWGPYAEKVRAKLDEEAERSHVNTDDDSEVTDAELVLIEKAIEFIDADATYPEWRNIVFALGFRFLDTPLEDAALALLELMVTARQKI